MTESKFDYLLACLLDPIEIIERHANNTPNAFAMRHPLGNYTYLALLAGINNVANEFHKACLRQGDTVAVQMADYFIALMSALALSRLGCICIFELVERQMNEVNVKALITKGGSHLKDIPQIEFQDSWFAVDQNPAPVLEFKKGFLSAESLAIYTMSSGSTGVPKIISSTWGDFTKLSSIVFCTRTIIHR